MAAVLTTHLRRVPSPCEAVRQDAAPQIGSEVLLHPEGDAVAHGIDFGGLGEEGLEVMLDHGVERRGRGPALPVDGPGRGPIGHLGRNPARRPACSKRAGARSDRRPLLGSATRTLRFLPVSLMSLSSGQKNRGPPSGGPRWHALGTDVLGAHLHNTARRGRVMMVVVVDVDHCIQCPKRLPNEWWRVNPGWSPGS